MATRLELRTRLKESGYQYLTDAQLNVYLDDAVREVQGEELWPWRVLEGTVTPGAATALGVIDLVQVSGSSRTLWPRRQSELAETYGDLSLAGDPRFYMIEVDKTGLTTLTTYPADTGLLFVRSYARAGWTSGLEVATADTDVPAMPARWHRMVVQAARIAIKTENGGEADVQPMIAKYDRDLDRMRDQELAQQWDEPDVIRLTERY